MPKDQSDYIYRQDAKDAELKKAWAEADPSFLEKASAKGLGGADCDRSGMAIDFDEHKIQINNPVHAQFIVLPDMAEALDTHVDMIVEKYPGQEIMVRQIAADLQIPMQVEIEKNRALMLGRVIGQLINTEGKNMLARIHQLLHSIPRLAVINGYPSLRRSALACGKSPEWIRRGRDEWCVILEIPVPEDGQKSATAKAKYRQHALSHHWRNRKFIPTTADPIDTTSCNQIQAQANSN